MRTKEVYVKQMGWILTITWRRHRPLIIIILPDIKVCGFSLVSLHFVVVVCFVIVVFLGFFCFAFCYFCVCFRVSSVIFFI